MARRAKPVTENVKKADLKNYLTRVGKNTERHHSTEKEKDTSRKKEELQSKNDWQKNRQTQRERERENANGGRTKRQKETE